jgi:DNA polymerase I
MKDRKKMWSEFKNMSDVEKQGGMSTDPNSSVLIIDGLNCFLRAFQSSPAMNDDGDHVGGISSFLKSIGYAIKLIKPRKVIIVFDGRGGSLKRRKIYSGYKNGRRTNIRLNRMYDTIGDDFGKNSQREITRLMQYLNNLPITTMSVDYVEADDTIAYLTKQYYNEKNVVIMSTDKDFLQLANEHVTIWSPTKKRLYGCHEILTEYGISCSNFIFYRVLSGDKSDNIDGIKGAGLKSIIKSFPFLSDENTSSLSEIINYSKNHVSKYKIYQNILDNEDILFRNYDLMQLSETQIQSFTQLRINDVIETQDVKLNKIELIKLITEDKMWNQIPDYTRWINECFFNLTLFLK